MDTVKNCMNLYPLKITENMLLKEAFDLLCKTSGYALPVINGNGEPLGLFSASNATGLLDHGSGSLKVRDIKLVKPVIIKEDTVITGDISILLDSLPVLVTDCAGRLCGIIGQSEVKALYQKSRECLIQEQDKAFDLKLTEIKRELNILRTVLDNAYEGIMILDEHGIIRYINDQNAYLLGVTTAESIGKHVTLITDKAGTHLVLETGKPDIGAQLQVNGRNMVVNRIPILENGKVIAAVGMVLFKDTSELFDLVKELNLMQSKVAQYKNQIEFLNRNKYSISSIVGNSQLIKSVKEQAIKIASTDATVLITGESGTGKELFAHTIHQFSHRSDQPFIQVNCAAIPKDLLESELFGYEEGAFTGALKKGKLGKFELARGGTILLDEIGDMPLEMQAKLLRVIQEKEIDRVGGNFPIKVDFRLIAATNQDIYAMVKQGTFRVDLYYRLNVCQLTIAPIRERKEDLPILVEHFLSSCSKTNGHIRISNAAISMLKSYDWPGNVRELYNVLLRAVTFMEGNIIEKNDLSIGNMTNQSVNVMKESDLREASDEAEKKTIQEALIKLNGNKSKVANLLGIHRSTLYEKMHKYNIIF